MLVDDDEKAIARRWVSLASRTRLPVSLERYLKEAPSQCAVANTRRRFARAPLRTIGVLRVGDVEHAVVVKDVSRLGVGFYAPVNLLPLKAMTLQLPGKAPLPLRAARCRRLGEMYYECGAKFDLAPSQPASRWSYATTATANRKGIV
jgi:hypothetical protein